MSAKIVTLHKNSDGVPYLATGSPHAYGVRRSWLHEALRPDLGALRIEPAKPVFREIPAEEAYPHPESCSPYQDANRLGFMLRTELPLLIVRTRSGKLLPDARSALAYARENEAQFAAELAMIERYAVRVLKPDVVTQYRARAPELFRDLVQPYSSFADGFFDIPGGFYCATGEGVRTVIGGPINRPSLLPVQTGVIDTEWHHHGLFVVARYPIFEGRSLLVLPEDDIAQLFFVSSLETGHVAVEHSVAESGGREGYEQTWQGLAVQLADGGKGQMGTQVGVSSISLECLHCRVSVTRAAEGGVPADHTLSRFFVAPYKVLRRQHQLRSEVP
jgi:hypothetical protein